MTRIESVRQVQLFVAIRCDWPSRHFEARVSNGLISFLIDGDVAFLVESTMRSPLEMLSAEIHPKGGHHVSRL